MQYQVSTDAPAPYQVKPVDYTAYGNSIAQTIREGTNQIGTIINAAKTVDETMDKEKLKMGIISEIQQQSPGVLKFMPPNPTFEQVARGAYQLNVVRNVYKQAQAASTKDENGVPEQTLPGSQENYEQIAFAGDEKQFEAIIKGLSSYIQEADKSKTNKKTMSAVQTGAGKGGTKEEKISATLAAPGAVNFTPEQGINLLKESAVSGKDIMSNETKLAAVRAKQDSEDAKLKYREKADRIKSGLAHIRTRNDALKDKVLVHNANLSFGKQLEDIDANIKREDAGMKAAKKRRVDAAKNKDLWAMAMNDPNQNAKDRAAAKTAWEDAGKIVDAADDDIAKYEQAARNYEESKKNTEVMYESFVDDMKKLGVDLVKGKGGYGAEAAPSDTTELGAAPAPISAPAESPEPNRTKFDDPFVTLLDGKTRVRRSVAALRGLQYKE